MTNGQSGEPLEGFDAAKAALYWGIHPQDAINMPVFWIETAAAISQAENAVRAKKEAAAGKKSGGRFGKFRR